MTGTKEVEYVSNCPQCDTQFIGVTPDEYRESHAPDCNPLLGLLAFTETNNGPD